MREILWHGRGGQGAFTAARLLGAAWSLGDGHHALAFPSFGPERRGAPMRAFTKLDSEPVCDHSACAQADYVIYLDQSLFAPGWECELKPGGRVLLNTAEAIDDPRVIAVDADGISRRILGRTMPNTAFLGALAALLDGLDTSLVQAAIRDYMAPKLHAGNIAVVEQAAADVEAMLTQDATPKEEARPACNLQPSTPAVGAPAAHSPVSSPVTPGPHGETQSLGDPQPTPAAKPAKSSPATGATASPASSPEASRPSAERIICRLSSEPLDPSVFARSTCFEAGHLVTRNAGWRQMRPVVDASACTGCLQCWMQCPDGTLVKTPSLDSRAGVCVQVDYDFCKGCGVCAKACKFGAITMVPEQGGEA